MRGRWPTSQTDTFHGGNALVKTWQLVSLCGNPTAVLLRLMLGGQVRQMDYMPNPNQTDPPDVAIAAIKDAYQQVGHTEKQPPRANEQAKLEQDAARYPSDQQKRLAVLGRRSSRGRLPLRGLIGLLMAACIGSAAIALRSHGDAAKQVIARWAPQPGLISSPAPENPVAPQPSPPAVQVSVAGAAPPQPAPPALAAQTAPEGAPPTAVAPSPEQVQLLQSI